MSPQAMPVDQAIVLVGKRDAGLPGPEWDPRKKILGLTVLERLVLSAYQAGVRHFLLVEMGGCQKDGPLPLSEKDRRFRKDDLRLEHVALSDLPDFVRRGKADDRFWLFDGDVVFDPTLLTEAGRDEPSRLGSLGPGIQLCGREMVPGLVESILKHGSATPVSPRRPESRDALPSADLSDKGKFCLKVGSREDAKKAAGYIMSTGRRPEDGTMARVFIRPVSLWMTGHLLKLNMTPNMMTAISLAFGGLSIWLISLADSRSAILAGCAFQFASILDHCDGANARMTFRVSKIGSAVDVLGDAIVYVLFFLSLPLGLYRADGRAIWLILGLVVFLSMVLYYFSVIRMARATGGGQISLSAASLFSFARKAGGTGGRPEARGKIERFGSRITFIFRREFFPTAVLLILICGGPKALMAAISVLYPVQGVYIAIQAQKQLSRRRAEEGRSAGRPG